VKVCLKRTDLFGKILNTFGARALAAVINLLIAIILSQYLGPAGKGVQSLIITTITFVLVFANLVGGATLVYLVPRHLPSLLILPSYIWTIFVCLVSYFILRFFPVVDESYIIHICILSAMNSIVSINTSILIGKEKISTSNLISLTQPFAIIICLLVFFTIKHQPRVQDYIWSLYISFGITVIVSLGFYFKHCGRIIIHSFNEYRKIVIEMVRYGLLNQVAHITQMLSFRLSYYVLDHYHGEAAVGVYSNGISLAESIWLISKSISLVQYARISNTESRTEAARLTVRLIKFSVVASLIILIPLMALPSSFYIFIFGEGFSDTRMVIWTLAFGVMVYNFSILTGHYFSGTGRYYVNAMASSLGLVASVILYYTLIPKFSLAGAGWATSISYLITTIILMTLFNRENKYWYKELVPSRGDFKQLRSELLNVMKMQKRS
jgi:O-antigen/teichoic acid export membrane protein